MILSDDSGSNLIIMSEVKLNCKMADCLLYFASEVKFSQKKRPIDYASEVTFSQKKRHIDGLGVASLLRSYFFWSSDNSVGSWKNIGCKEGKDSGI